MIQITSLTFLFLITLIAIQVNLLPLPLHIQIMRKLALEPFYTLPGLKEFTQYRLRINP